MIDRQANDPGRIKLVEDGGTTPKYYYMEMADNPVTNRAGTPLNKANLLSDTTDAIVHGSTNEATHTVNTAFNELGTARVRPHDGKFYTFFPDLKHPYIDFSEHFGTSAKSHIVITKDYYVYQSTANGANSINFKIHSKSSTSTSTTFTLSGAAIVVNSIKSDPNENIVEIRYSEADVHSVCFVDVSNPTVYSNVTSQYGETMNPVMIRQGTIGANRYFWTFQNYYDNADQEYAICLRQYKITTTGFTNVNENVTPYISSAFSVSRMIYDSEYFYYFGDNYISLDDEDQNQSYKVFRWNINGLTNRKAFRVFNGSSRWTYDEWLRWTPYWIDETVENNAVTRTFYLRSGTGSQTVAYYLYSASIDEDDRKIIFTKLSNDAITDTITYAGHLDTTHVLFTGTSGSGASARSKNRIITVSSTSATIGALKTTTVMANDDLQSTPLISTTSRTKHSLSTTPFVAAGDISAVTVNGTNTVTTFHPIYQPYDISGEWIACSVFEIAHVVNNTNVTSWVISSPSYFTVLTTASEKSDIRYLPGYFREGRV